MEAEGKEGMSRPHQVGVEQGTLLCACGLDPLCGWPGAPALRPGP